MTVLISKLLVFTMGKEYKIELDSCYKFYILNKIYSFKKESFFSENYKIIRLSKKNILIFFKF